MIPGFFNSNFNLQNTRWTAKVEEITSDQIKVLIFGLDIDE